MKTFLAAVLEELNAPLALRELEIPQDLYVGQVLVKVHYAGICGRTLIEQSGVLGPDPYLPHLTNHEGSGIVSAIGPGVRHVRPGDHVVLHWRKGAGIDATAPKYWSPGLRQEIGAGQVTTFQEYAVVSENRVTKISRDIDLEIAALFGCSVSTGLGICCNEAQIKVGESVVVFGCGGIGLNILQGAELVSAYPIVGVDIVEEKLTTAKFFGATHTVRSGSHDIVDRIKAIVGSKGADIVVDTTGIPAVIETAWKLTANTGKCFIVAQSGKDQFITLHPMDVHSGKRLVASDGGATNPTVDIPRYLKLVKAGRLNLERLITHRWPLTEINTALDTVRTGKVGRAIIEMV